MSHIYDLLHKPTSEDLLVQGAAYSGWISKPATSLTTRVAVVIPSISEQYEFPGVRWMARDDTALPARGDACLVIFDENKDPWVTVWWPFDT